MTQIKAPFTPSQVDFLNKSQVGVISVFPAHPFTCPNRLDGITSDNSIQNSSKTTHSSEGGDSGILIATEAGWICPHCGYTQDWAHESMVKASSPQGEENIASTLDTLGIDSGTYLLEKTEKTIAQYWALHMSKKLSRSQSSEENKKSGRVHKTTEVMLSSLRRCRLKHLGVHVDSAKKMIAIDPAWRDLKKEKPKGKTDVYLIFQDQPTAYAGGISNPAHEGFGCNAWIEVGSFWDDYGTHLTTGGIRTHWREIPQHHVDQKMLATEESL